MWIYFLQILAWGLKNGTYLEFIMCSKRVFFIIFISGLFCLVYFDIFKKYLDSFGQILFKWSYCHHWFRLISTQWFFFSFLKNEICDCLVRFFQCINWFCSFQKMSAAGKTKNLLIFFKLGTVSHSFFCLILRFQICFKHRMSWTCMKEFVENCIYQVFFYSNFGLKLRFFTFFW